MLSKLSHAPDVTPKEAVCSIIIQQKYNNRGSNISCTGVKRCCNLTPFRRRTAEVGGSVCMGNWGWSIWFVVCSVGMNCELAACDGKTYSSHPARVDMIIWEEGE